MRQRERERVREREMEREGGNSGWKGGGGKRGHEEKMIKQKVIKEVVSPRREMQLKVRILGEQVSNFNRGVSRRLESQILRLYTSCQSSNLILTNSSK